MNYELKQRCECHMVGQQAQHNRDAGEYQHDFLLAPAAHFKVVVYGRHFENSFAVRRLEVAYLKHIREHFDCIDYSLKQDYKRTVYGISEGYNHTAEEH